MEIVLDKRTTIITKNIEEGDYFRLNPFNPDGTFGIDVMSVIVDLEEEWNGVQFYFYLPEISTLPTFNFQAQFSSYTKASLLGAPIFLYAGNDIDAWDNGFIVSAGVMTWTPQSFEPTLDGEYGWWLVEQPNTEIPAEQFTPVEPGVAERTASEDTTTTIGGHLAFRELTAKFKK